MKKPIASCLILLSCLVSGGVSHSVAQAVADEITHQAFLPVNPLPNVYDLQNKYNAGAYSDLEKILPVNPLDISRVTPTVTTTTTEETGARFTYSKQRTTTTSTGTTARTSTSSREGR